MQVVSFLHERHVKADSNNDRIDIQGKKRWSVRSRVAAKKEREKKNKPATTTTHVDQIKPINSLYVHVSGEHVRGASRQPSQEGFRRLRPRISCSQLLQQRNRLQPRRGRLRLISVIHTGGKNKLS